MGSHSNTDPPLPPRNDRRWLLTILLVLVAFVGLRLVGIDTPCTGSHGWRQADTLAIARNYLTEDSSFLRPRVDRRGDLTGIAGCEFPLLNYGIFLAYRVLGFHDWVGRAVVLLISVLASLFLLAHVRQRADRTTAIAAVLFMNSAPVYFYYSRCVMPDTVAVCAALAALWAFAHWLERDRARWLVGSGVAAALALLIKPSAGILLFGFAWCLLRRFRWRAFTQPRLWLWTLGILAPFCWWYGYEAPWLNETYGLGAYFHIRPNTLEGWRQLVSTNLSLIVVNKQLLGLLTSRLALVFAAVLAWAAWRGRRDQAAPARPQLHRQLDDVYRGWFVGFLVLVLCDAQMFRFHEYYGLPIVPAIAIVCAMGTRAARRWAGAVRQRQALVWGVVLLVVILGAKRGYAFFGASPDREAIAAVQRVIPRDSLVVTVDRQCVVQLYVLGQKGWSAFPDTPVDSIRGWISQGARLLISDDREWERRPEFARLLAEAEVVLDSPVYRVFRFRQ